MRDVYTRENIPRSRARPMMSRNESRPVMAMLSRERRDDERFQIFYSILAVLLRFSGVYW